MLPVVLALAGVGWAAGPAAAQVSFFVNNQAGFNAAVAGRTLIGVETFEESTVGAGQILATNDPLQQGVANANFPAGLVQPLIMQSNQNGANPAATNPRGANGLATFGPGGGGNPNKVVSTNFFVDATDYLFSLTAVSAVGFNPFSFSGSGTFTVTVFNTANVQIGQTTVPADGGQTNHFGVLTTDGSAIGRINLFDPANTVEGADNIELRATSAAVPEPATLACVGMGLVGGATFFQRRRRRRVVVRAAA